MLDTDNSVQDIYNAIYRLCENHKDEKLDSGQFFEALFEKMVDDPDWKIFVQHLGNEYHLAGVFWISPAQQSLYIKDNYGKFRNVANALVENEMAKSYSPFQFNARIQSMQSVESFNGIIKKSLSSASTLCDVEKAIKKRLEDKS
ncbi:36843_t:CDS:2 [Gigaspora margarita]|uniref:36843_t:CDS:1 n=1 Tax=Gigaspora margarita TaxID=4874 RepID=A0ABN7WCM8_GIGMA|nr:36843_t:CDS:2 [Gigaspora margarita]